MIVFQANQSILINCHTEKHNKNKSKKRFVGVTKKLLKTEEYLNTYDGKLFKRNYWNTLKGATKL